MKSIVISTIFLEIFNKSMFYLQDSKKSSIFAPLFLIVTYYVWIVKK